MKSPSDMTSNSGWSIAFAALRMRARFVLVLAVLAAIALSWPWMTNGWDRLVAWISPKSLDNSVASNSEYFCPMDPGVVSVWPAMCPICNMDLIVRKKGDAAILPDGVIARMQISPYRLTMSGVKTVSVQSSPKEASDSSTNPLLVPRTAIVHRAGETIVYVERSPGMLDAVRVVVGDYGDDLSEIVAGDISAGQRVVAMGTLLVDAESRLNPNLSTQYFGASDQLAAIPTPKANRPKAETIEPQLNTEEQRLVTAQQFCPVTQAELGSMGTPVFVQIGERKVALCCDGCEKRMLKEPDKYLNWLDQKLSSASETK